MTRMQLIRTLRSWRPDASEYRNVTNVYRIALKSLASRKTNRYRLNRGGDRAANSTLHIIAIGRLRTEDSSPLSKQNIRDSGTGQIGKGTYRIFNTGIT